MRHLCSLLLAAMALALPAVGHAQDTPAFDDWLAQARVKGQWECEGYNAQFGYCDTKTQYTWLTDAKGILASSLHVPGPNLKWVEVKVMTPFAVADGKVCVKTDDMQMKVQDTSNGSDTAVSQSELESVIDAFKRSAAEVCSTFTMKSGQMVENVFLDGKPSTGENSVITFHDAEPALCSRSDNAPKDHQC